MSFTIEKLIELYFQCVNGLETVFKDQTALTLINLVILTILTNAFINIRILNYLACLMSAQAIMNILTDKILRAFY